MTIVEAFVPAATLAILGLWYFLRQAEHDKDILGETIKSMADSLQEMGTMLNAYEMVLDEERIFNIRYREYLYRPAFDVEDVAEEDEEYLTDLPPEWGLDNNTDKPEYDNGKS